MPSSSQASASSDKRPPSHDHVKNEGLADPDNGQHKQKGPRTQPQTQQESQQQGSSASRGRGHGGRSASRVGRGGRGGQGKGQSRGRGGSQMIESMVANIEEGDVEEVASPSEQTARPNDDEVQRDSPAGQAEPEAAVPEAAEPSTTQQPSSSDDTVKVLLTEVLTEIRAQRREAAEQSTKLRRVVQQASQVRQQGSTSTRTKAKEPEELPPLEAKRAFNALMRGIMGVKKQASFPAYPFESEMWRYTSSDELLNGLFAKIGKKEVADPFKMKPLCINWDDLEAGGELETILVDWAAAKIQTGRSSWEIPEDASVKDIRNACRDSLRGRKYKIQQRERDTDTYKAKEAERRRGQRRRERVLRRIRSRKKALRSLGDFDAEDDYRQDALVLGIVSEDESCNEEGEEQSGGDDDNDDNDDDKEEGEEGEETDQQPRFGTKGELVLLAWSSKALLDLAKKLDNALPHRHARHRVTRPTHLRNPLTTNPKYKVPFAAQRWMVAKAWADEHPETVEAVQPNRKKLDPDEWGTESKLTVE